MPPQPAPGGTAQWWTVFYLQSQNQVSSRFASTPSPNGAGSATGWKVVQAASAAAASAQVAAQLGTGGTVTTVDGPFATQAAAQADGQQAQASIAQQEQAGSIPGIGTFSVFPNLGTWLIRAAQIFLGLVLVAVGVARLTNTVPVATQVAKTAGAVALA